MNEGTLEDIKELQGATVEFSFEDDDSTADTATIIVKQDTDQAVPDLIEPASFVDQDDTKYPRVAFFSFPADILPGEYIYQITVTYTGGQVLKFPLPGSDCDGEDCAFPAFVVCASLDGGVS